VNLFEVPDGWAIPVTFGPKQGRVQVSLKNVPGLTGNLKAFALYPGSERKVPVALTRSNDTVQMDVDIRRGCALIKIEKEN
jgi:hypothetical protein